MTQTFECPSCGGPLDLPRYGSPAIRCSYCGRTVVVPPELRENPQAGAIGSPETVGSDLLSEIDRFIAAGKKIAAVKRYRETTGSTLREAKEYVERREAGEEIGTIRSTERTADVTIDFPVRRLQRRPGRRRGTWVAAAILLAILFFSSLPALTGPGALLSTLKGPLENQTTPAGTTRSAVIPATGAVPTRVTTPTTPPFAEQILAFGGEGIGPGLFEDARSIAVDPNGNIYVGEYTGGRIQVFDSQGEFVSQWMVDPETPLRGLAVNRQGVVFVAQSGRIDRYEGGTGEALGTLEYAGGWGFDDVATAADGGFVAAWYANRDDLVRFDNEGRVLQTIPEAISGQSGDSELNTRVAVDGLGNVYALGTFNDAVFKFNSQGRFQTRFGSAGDEPGQFRAPSSIAVDGRGLVYVGDFKGIQVFDSEGRYLERIVVEGVPSGLAFNDSGDLFVAARTQVLVFRINP